MAFERGFRAYSASIAALQCSSNVSSVPSSCTCSNVCSEPKQSAKHIELTSLVVPATFYTDIFDLLQFQRKKNEQQLKWQGRKRDALKTNEINWTCFNDTERVNEYRQHEKRKFEI